MDRDQTLKRVGVRLLLHAGSTIVTFGGRNCITFKVSKARAAIFVRDSGLNVDSPWDQ